MRRQHSQDYDFGLRQKSEESLTGGENAHFTCRRSGYHKDYESLSNKLELDVKFVTILCLLYRSTRYDVLIRSQPSVVICLLNISKYFRFERVRLFVLYITVFDSVFDRAFFTVRYYLY